jgi:glutamate-1-semialdehyde aminotransferase
MRFARKYARISQVLKLMGNWHGRRMQVIDERLACAKTQSWPQPAASLTRTIKMITFEKLS